jgi:hypothetical protein
LIAACPPQPSSASPYPPQGLETDPTKHHSPRQIVSQSLLQLLERHGMTSTPAEPFCERLPKILSAAAKLLKTDFDFSADQWLPVLRVADTIFQSTETLIRQIDMSNVSPSFQQRFYRRLSQVIFQICITLSEDCPTSLQTMRFLSSLIEAIENLLDCLSIDRTTEWTRTYTPTLWLDTAEREINALRLLLPEDTPVFTCPFPLAGCNYQTTDMRQWILHRDQCDKQRSVSRSAGTLEKERDELLDLRYRVRPNLRRFCKVARVFAMLWHEPIGGAATTRPALRERARNITRSVLSSFSRTGVFQPHRDWYRDAIFVGDASPQVDRRQLFESRRQLFEEIYRIVWLELFQLFGLCMLSVLLVCTNMLGFVVCWLTILRSINTWKCTGRSLLLM